jgi:SAM-dependent methyltransferase
MDDDLLGLAREPGDEHYRAYVGPPQDYDLVSAMAFSLLTACGLRQSHKLLDIGCGSLRLGRLLIPYLNPGNYYGLEPNKWLVDEGRRYEVGDSLVEVRQPTFIYSTTLADCDYEGTFDFAVAQSIFSHTGPDLLRQWMQEMALTLSERGVLFATIIEGDKDCGGSGWIYPECVEFRPATVAAMAAEEGLEFRQLKWYHPRQSWCVMFKPGFDASVLNQGEPSWNHLGALAGG